MRPERIPASCLDDNVFVPSVQKYFSPDAWIALMNVLDTVKKNAVWYCGACEKAIDDEKKIQLFANHVLTGFISLVYQSRQIQNKLNGFVEVVTSNYYFD